MNSAILVPQINLSMIGDRKYSVEFQTEKTFVEAFIKLQKRDRFIELMAKPKGRLKLLASLPHFKDLDPEVMSPIPRNLQNPASIENMLAGLGAPKECYLISEDRRWDGKRMELGTALHYVVGYGAGTLILCMPATLGYYEGESPGERYILRKPRSG